MTKQYFTNYNINGKYLSCSRDDKRKVCDLVSKLKGSAVYNDSRLYKLQTEFYCSDKYHTTFSSRITSAEDKAKYNANKYKCYSVDAQNLAAKLNSVASIASGLSKEVIDNSFDTYSVMQKASALNSELISLQNIVGSDKNFANNLFDHAIFDTATSGVLSSFLFFPVGLVASAMYNNEFDGKIARAVDEAQQVASLASELASEILYC